MISWDPDGEGPERPLLVVAGSFLQAGEIAVKNIAAWDGTRWIAVGTGFDIPSDSFSPTFTLGTFQGRLVAALSNTTVGTQMFTWDGRNWTAVPGTKPRTITCFAEYQGRLIVGTSDDNYGTVQQGRFLVSFDGALWYAGYAGGLSSAPSALVVHEGRLIASGSFGAAGGVATSSIAEWDGVSWNELETGLRRSSGNATGLSLLSIGTDLVVGGTFDFAGGEQAKNIALWNGAFWQPMGAGFSTSVLSVIVHEGDICVATGNGVFRWTGWTWLSLGWQAGSSINRIASSAGSLFAGGTISSSSSPTFRGLARLDGTNWVGVSEGFSADLLVAFAFHDGVYVGLSGSGHKLALRFWNGQGLVDPFPAATEYWSRVTAIGVFKDELVVAGELTPRGQTSGASLTVAAWRDGQWRRFGSATATLNNVVHAIAEHRGELFIGGEFGRVDATNASSVARWDGVAWRAMGGTNGRVRALASLGNDLILAGFFSAAASVQVSNIAAWSPSGFRALGAGLNSEVRALVGSQGGVIAGGNFGRSGSISVSGLGLWNGTTWSGVPGWTRTGVLALAVAPDGAMLVGGTFTAPTSNGTANNLAELRGGVWRALGVGVNGSVSSIAAWRTEWTVAGGFGFAGSTASYAFARWTTNGAPVLSSAPRSRYASCGESLQLAVEVAAGYPAATFLWRRNAHDIDTGSNPSASSATLLLASAASDTDGVYECVVTNGCGSTVAAATIASDCCPADLDDDSRVGDSDFSLFVAAYDAVDCESPSMPSLCPSDLNRDGLVDDADFQWFAISYVRVECER